MGSGGEQHNVLDDFWHVFAGRATAGKHLHGEQDKEQEHAKLRHTAGYGGE